MALGIKACTLSPECPALYGDYDRDPRHYKGRNPHCDGKGEHGIQAILLKYGHRVLVADHKGNTARNKAERGNDLGRWAGWEK
jgi:hypothetical protein